MNKKAQAIWLFAIILLIIFFGIFLGYTGIHYKTTINGEHNGQITAVEKNGLIWKTWDIYFKSELESSQEDRYCVIDENVVNKLKEYSKNRAKVTLYYYSILLASWTECNTNDIVYDVKEVTK